MKIRELYGFLENTREVFEDFIKHEDLSIYNGETLKEWYRRMHEAEEALDTLYAFCPVDRDFTCRNFHDCVKQGYCLALKLPANKRTKVYSTCRIYMFFKEQIQTIIQFIDKLLFKIKTELEKRGETTIIG